MRGVALNGSEWGGLVVGGTEEVTGDGRDSGGWRVAIGVAFGFLGIVVVGEESKLTVNRGEFHCQ